MPARTVSVFVLCTAVCLAGAHMSRGQEATSANLPDQFQTGEMIQIHKPKKEEKRTEFPNCSNRDEARRCTCTRAAAGGCRSSTNASRAGGREKDRAQPEYCLGAAKPKSGDSHRTSTFCGRAGSNRRACRKETSTEKTASTRCAS